MASVLFLAILLFCGVIFGCFALIEKRKQYSNQVVQGMTGVQKWRLRLNGITDSFIKLGTDPLLRAAASKSNDPSLTAFTGQTLTYYNNFKANYVALSFAYNVSSRAVQTSEGQLTGSGLKKAANLHKVTKLAELAVEIKEIRPESYTRLVALSRFSPKPPSYQVDYLFDVCEKMIAEVNAGLTAVRSAPVAVHAALAKSDAAIVIVGQLHEALVTDSAAYTPYDNKLAAIAAKRAQIVSAIAADPIGAGGQCANLNKLIEALAAELRQAQQMVLTVQATATKLEKTREWVARVRSTAVTCPWADSNGDEPYWHLDTPDSDPDGQLSQCETLLAQARSALSSGALANVAGGSKQGLAACTQAENMVKAMFAAKTAVDEQVPTVRAELAAVRAELHAVTGGGSTQEMAALVERTCEAVVGRIDEVYALYRKQQFPAALALLTGSSSNEYGLPVAKLLAQSKELLRLLKQAAQVAGTLSSART